jgi:hypothetical protein
MVFAKNLPQKEIVRCTRGRALRCSEHSTAVGTSTVLASGNARRLVLSLSIVLSWSALAYSEEFHGEVGLLGTQAYLPVRPVGSVQYQPALGAVGAMHLYKGMDFDWAASFTPSKPITSTSFAGGHLTQGYFGIRVGYGRGRTSFYVKARPGVVTFAEAILHVSPSGALHLGRLTEPATDVGTVFLVRLSHRFFLRYEAGDSIIYYRSRVLEAGSTQSPSHIVNSLQIGTGVLLRF